MAIPFEYGELVFQTSFVNREKDRKRLAQNLKNGLNTMLISPRRWGKSSLVKQVALDEENRNVKFIFIDFFNMTDETEFYQQLISQVLKTTSSKVEEWLKTSQKFLQRISPKISLGIDPINDFEVQFDYNEGIKNYKEILDFTEKVAQEKNIRLVVCIDEFQNLGRFSDPLLFQQRLRSSWQHHKHVSYCLYGSKKSMMVEIFQNKSMPFYKFGDVIFLEKIESEHWTKFIQSQFRKTGKKITKKWAEKIVATVDRHSYYVQQLSHLVWIRTEKEVNEEIFEAACNDIISQNSIMFNREVEHLSNTQINFLKALVNDEEQYHSKDVIRKYKLGSSSNVSRIKEALEQKEVIDNLGEKPILLDPIFGVWFKKKFC